MVEGEGFEPSKAVPTDLQSVPFGRSGTPPKSGGTFCWRKLGVSTGETKNSSNPVTATAYTY